MNAADRGVGEGAPAGGEGRPSRPPAPSPFRAWCYLAGLSLRGQARSRQMLWIALGLLVVSVLLVSINTRRGRWNMQRREWPRGSERTMPQAIDEFQLLTAGFHRSPGANAVVAATFGSARVILSPTARTTEGKVLNRLGFVVFSRGVIFSLFLPFLLPVWSLAFATESLGGERESGTLVWLLTRPLSRPAVYLAKFVGVLPWSLGFNLAAFLILCLAAGPPGRQAVRAYWPAVVAASLAFSSLFFLLGATTRWPAVLGMVYAFCLEVVLANMPGYFKRVSIRFYARCLMMDAAERYGVRWEDPGTFLPVDGATALVVLLGGSAVLVVAGAVLFSQIQYREQA